MITRAYISRYKSIAEADLPFGPMNVIVGRNANGKSNIVDAISFVHDAIVEDLDTAIVKRHGIESIRQWSKTRPYYITIEITFEYSAGRGKYKVVIGSGRGVYRVVEEHGEWLGEDRYFTDENQSPVNRMIAFNRGEDGRVYFTTDPEIKNISEPPINVPVSELFATTLAGPIFSMFAIMARPLVDSIRSFAAYSIYPNTLREPRVVSREDSLRADGSNLSSVLKVINSGHKKSKESILESLQLIMPNIMDVSVRSAGGYYVPIIRVREVGGEAHEFNMSQVSDGTLRVLGLLTAFYQPNAPAMIAVEEPEQMVHPGILPVIADAAKAFVARGHDPRRQIFMTTHSPTLLDEFEPESIIWTKQENGITKCGPINYRQLSIIKKNLFSAGELFLSEDIADK